jgi:trigger factor
LLPQVKLGDYKKIKVKSDKSKEIKVSDEEIDQVLSHLARQNAQFKDIAGPLKIGDRVELNFEGFEKGVRLDNLSSKNYPVILGSKTLIPEFEAKIIGLQKGEKKEFNIEMNSKGEGKKRIDFKVEIVQTQEVILPKMDNIFAKKFQKNSIAELKKAIGEDIIKQKKEQQEKETENAVLDKLLKIINVEVPESLINQEIERQINEMRSRVSMFGITFEQYLANMKKSLDEFKEGLKPQAEKTIKIGLALGEIVKKENIDPKNKEAGKLALQKLISYAESS